MCEGGFLVESLWRPRGEGLEVGMGKKEGRWGEKRKQGETRALALQKLARYLIVMNNVESQIAQNI